MTIEVKHVEYYNIVVEGHIGAGAKLLSLVADIGVSLLAFNAVSLGSTQTQFRLVPGDNAKMRNGAKQVGLEIDGPHAALFIQGDTDESGELASIYERLALAGISVDESSGIADINGSYGVMLYLAHEDCENAMVALKA